MCLEKKQQKYTNPWKMLALQIKTLVFSINFAYYFYVIQI